MKRNDFKRQRVAKGDRLAIVHARTDDAAARAVDAVHAAIEIGAAAGEILPLIAWRVTAAGVTPYGAS